MLWTHSPRAAMGSRHRPHPRPLSAGNPLAVALILTALAAASLAPTARCAADATSEGVLSPHRPALNPPPAGLEDSSSIFDAAETNAHGSVVLSPHPPALNPPPAGLRDSSNIFVTPEKTARGKRTIDILLQGLAEALGYELKPRTNGTAGPRRQQKPAAPPATPKAPPLSPKPPTATKASMPEEVTPKGTNASDSDLQAQRESSAEDERSHEDLKEDGPPAVGVDDYFRDTAGNYFRKEYDRIKASERNPAWGINYYDEDDKGKVPVPAKRDEEQDDNYYQYFLPAYSAPTASSAAGGEYANYPFGSGSGDAPKYTFTASSEGPASYYAFGQPLTYSFEIPYQTTTSQQQQQQQQQELQPQEQRQQQQQRFRQRPPESRGQQVPVELLSTVHPLHTQVLFVPPGVPKDPKVLNNFKASYAGQLPISSTSKPQMAQILQEMEGTKQDSLWPPPFDYAFDSTDASAVADKPAAVVQQNSVVAGKSAQLVSGPTQWPQAAYQPGEVLPLLSAQQPVPLYRPTDPSPAGYHVSGPPPSPHLQGSPTPLGPSGWGVKLPAGSNHGPHAQPPSGSGSPLALQGPPLPLSNEQWANIPTERTPAGANHGPLLPLAHSPAPYYPPLSDNPAPPAPETNRNAAASKNAAALRSLGWPSESNKTAAAIRNEAATTSLAKALSWFNPSTAAFLDTVTNGAAAKKPNAQQAPVEKTKTTTQVGAYVGIVIPFQASERRGFQVADDDDGLLASPTSPVAVKAAAPEREYSYPPQRIDSSRTDQKEFSTTKPQREYSFPPPRGGSSRAEPEREYSFPSQGIDGSRGSQKEYSTTKPERKYVNPPPRGVSTNTAQEREYAYPRLIDTSRSLQNEYSTLKPEQVYSYPTRRIGSSEDAPGRDYSYSSQRIDSSRADLKEYSTPKPVEKPEKVEQEQTYQQALYASTTTEPSFYRPQIASSPKPFTRDSYNTNNNNAIYGKDDSSEERTATHKPYPFYEKPQQETNPATTAKPYIPPANHYGIRLPPSTTTTTTTTTQIPPRSREASATDHKQQRGTAGAAPPTSHYGIRLPPPPPPPPPPLRRRPRPLTPEEEARRHHVEFLRHPHHLDDYDHAAYEDYPEVAGVRYLFDDDDEQEATDEAASPSEEQQQGGGGGGGARSGGPRWRPGPAPYAEAPYAPYEPPEGSRDFYRPPAHASAQQQQQQQYYRHPHSSFNVQSPLSDDYTSLDYYFADPPAQPRYRRPRPSARLAMREAQEAAEAVKRRSEAFNTAVPPTAPAPTPPSAAASAEAAEAAAPTAVASAALAAPSTSKSLSKETISRVSKLQVTGKVHFYPDDDEGLEGKIGSVGLRKR